MTIRAYQETYLPRAQSVLGDAFDYAVNACKMSGQDFVKLFTVSSFSSRIENGEPSLLLGKSGIEIARDVILETTGKEEETTPVDDFFRSEAYWIGWSASYYQWYSSAKFSEIFDALPYRDLQVLYPTLHEADISKFVLIAEERLNAGHKETSLKRIRTYCRITQAELAERSGTGLRSIQMYEQRQKDINKAGADTLQRIANTLGCRVEDLLEK